MDNEASTSLNNRIQYYAAVEFLVYWLTGALVWIPWYFSETLGIIGMLVFTPIFILLGTLNSLNQTHQRSWKKEIWVIIGSFVVTCVIIDLFFWVGWRGKDIFEWFLPITSVGIGNFVGYLEMLIVGYLSMFLASRYSIIKRIQVKLVFSYRSIVVSGVILFLFSLVSAILFW